MAFKLVNIGYKSFNGIMRYIFVLIIFCFNIIAAQSISISPNSIIINRNNQISIDINVNDMQNLAAYSFHLTYNKDVLHCNSIIKENFLSQNSSTFFFANVDSLYGKVQIDEAILGTGTVSGNGTLARLTFTSKDTGLSPLAFVNQDFRGSENIQLTIFSSGGIVKVQNNLQVEEDKMNFILVGNYPNPFNSSTIFEINLEKSEVFSLDIFNLNGELVRSIFGNKKLETGLNKVNFNAVNLPSGIYLYRLYNNYFSKTNKMILLK